jgi:predicted nucleotidyltransferase
LTCWVEFEPDVRYTYFTLAQVAADLSGLLRHRADLHMPKTLHPLLRDKVLSQAEALYVGS